MILKSVKVTNYLSINGESELPIDPRVTVLLGANDHGKSNLLRSLEHLNFGNPITGEDQNWDSKSARLDFHFAFTTKEADELAKINDELRAELTRLQQQKEALHNSSVEAPLDSDDDESDNEDSDEDDESAAEPIIAAAVPSPVVAASNLIIKQPTASATAAKLVSVVEDDEDDEERTEDDVQADITYLSSVLARPGDVVLYRDGIGSDLKLEGRSVETLSGAIIFALGSMIPRVELFKAFSGELQDSVTAAEITKDDAEFLQGIFFYAGIDPLACSELFIHDDETDKQLEEASARLDDALRERWAQGVDLDLHFQLKHRGTESIELLVEDPAVRRRKARMSKRSAGVTQFFRLSMVLHARRMKNPANSYIYVFDEPGVFLHPKGQKDLLSVFEQLGLDTQIIYATHSLFMLNQNFPERHRLITKTSKSTVVDAKPYRANWKYAVDALGVRLTANILFSPNILLVEGDSDPIYLFELIRVLNHLGHTDGDANLLGIMSYGDLPNLRFLMQTFKTESNERLLSVLFDGDSQGKQYAKDVANLVKRFGVETAALAEGSAIEDYCLSPEIFLEAVEDTLRASFEAMDKKPSADFQERIKTSFEAFLSNRSKGPSKQRQELAQSGQENSDASRAPENAPNAGSWFGDISHQLLGGNSSKVSLARNYAFKSRERGAEVKIDPKRIQSGKVLVDAIIKQLKLPSQRAKREIESSSNPT